MTRAVDGDRYLERKIRIAYRDYPGKNDHSALPILLLHGSPGSADDFTRISAASGSERVSRGAPVAGASGADSAPQPFGGHRLIAPDLPGFGHSTREIPDYSFRAHARYVIELLNQLKLPRVHVVAFSMGGGPALHLAEFAPERVASITMISAIGAQEMELLGDYHTNHAVHGLQLGIFWLLREALPLTPAAYSHYAGVAYSRNFYDSDQRPLRDLIARYAGPMLIIHGRKDFLAPVEAAIEHHRLSPQSELVLSDYDHFMVFTRPDYLAPIIGDFVNRVEAGKALTRANADPARVVASERPFDPKDLPKFIGVTAFVVTLLLAGATLVSEDLTCVTAGVLAAQGRISLALASFACFLGIFVGDLLLFLAGRWFGRAALRRSPVKWFVKEDDARRGSEWFSRQGLKVIIASRFLPGARLPTYFVAGAIGAGFWKFAFYFALACALWTPLLVSLSMILGREVIESALLGGQTLLFTDTLIQEYVPGEEIGVFYYRYPDQPRGRIFAITEKRFPSVVGDGSSALERLILNDDRAVCVARLLLNKHAGRLLKTPLKGERVQLVEIGAHCRGAMFLDGWRMKTDQLEEAIDQICRGYDGFYFGRFDLRAESVEEFKLGRNFKVIELNGVSSEATSVYDPKNSVFAAYKVLFEQWRIAFEIGDMNRARGARPSSARRLLKEMVHYQVN